MSAAKLQAVKWIKRGVRERVDELTDAWLSTDGDTAEDDAKRARLHREARATLELEDYLSARIAEYAAE